MAKATVNIFLDSRKSASNNGILKLSITHNRVKRLFTTQLSISQDIFNILKKYHDRDIDGRIKDGEVINYHNLLYAPKDEKQKIYIDGFVVRAKNIIDKLESNFDFEKFRFEFETYGKDTTDSESKTDLIKVLNQKCENLKSKGQLSHGINFGLVSKSLERFVKYVQVEDPNRLKPKKNFVLRFSHVDSEFLSDWACFMREQGKLSQKKINGVPIEATGASETTISIYSRALRTVFNEAIYNKVIDEDCYPFGKHGFVPPEGRNIKKALTTSQIDAIKAYKPETETSLEQRSLDLWLFSYFGNGMNFTDILRLKWEDVKGNTIEYQRQKTKENPITISVRINDTIKAILDRWGNKRKGNNDLVFPFLNGINTAEKQKNEIHQIIKLTNKYMNKIGAKLDIDVKINTYEARHSFATRLMRSNAPLAMIKDKLGHKKISTTEKYLGSFEKEVEEQYLDLL
jgi:integrase